MAPPSSHGLLDHLVANPPADPHQRALVAYLLSAHSHLDLAWKQAAAGDCRAAWDAGRYAEGDVRQAYTEAHYGEIRGGALRRVSTELQKLYSRIRATMDGLRESC